MKKLINLKQILQKEIIIFVIIFTALISLFTYTFVEHVNLTQIWQDKYPVHKNIFATTFWVGEGATRENDNISNTTSAWDNHWVAHYGGNDDPVNHDGYYPENFTPKENPFYFALPYNDFDTKRRKANATSIPWYFDGVKNSESLLKNRWIMIKYNKSVCYGQWEDVGPFGEEDFDYVFLSTEPKNERAGIDLSPALTDCLEMENNDYVEWQFIEAKDVPEGPWKEIITTSQIDWNISK